MSAAPDEPQAEQAPPDRDLLLELLEDGIREAHRKVESGRVYDPENEKVRIQWIRALAYAVNIHRQTLKDKELDEMNDRLEELEARQGINQ